MTPADVALLFGYVLAVPFTLFTPGFLRLWRRREIEVFALAQAGAALIAGAWLAKGNLPAAAVNATWFVGLTVAYVLAGRRQVGTAHASEA